MGGTTPSEYLFQPIDHVALIQVGKLGDINNLPIFPSLQLLLFQVDELTPLRTGIILEPNRIVNQMR